MTITRLSEPEMADFRGSTINDQNQEPDSVSSLRRSLADARDERLALERELVTLRAEKRVLEERVLTANRTLAYGLGRALIEARSIKGFFALPGKIRRLAKRQRMKRRSRVPNILYADASRRMRFVEPLLEKARQTNADEALAWLDSQAGEDDAKSRAIIELALHSIADDPQQALALARRANEYAPGNVELLGLARTLHRNGYVRGPAELCRAASNAIELTDAQRSACDTILADAALLESDINHPGVPLRRSESSLKKLLVRCPGRWRDTRRVRQICAAAAAAGYDPFLSGPDDDCEMSEFGTVHVLADRLDTLERLVSQACQDSCRVIADLAGVGDHLTRRPDSEGAEVERRRLALIEANSFSLVQRGRPIGQVASIAGGKLYPISGIVGSSRATIDSAAIDIAVAEFGLDPSARRIAMAVPLGDDRAVRLGLAAFAMMVERDQTERLLLFGEGRGAYRREAAELGLLGRIDYVGMPLPDRWEALLGASTRLAFPQTSNPDFGSELPLLLETAAYLGGPTIASDALQQSVGMRTENAAIWTTSDGFYEVLHASDSARFEPSEDSVSMEAFYSSLPESRE